MDTGPDHTTARVYATETDQTAAATPALLDDAGTVGLPPPCVDLLAAPAGRDSNAARLHFTEGAARFDAGDYPAALSAMCEAYRESPHAGLLYNAGLACERVGLFTEAADFLDAFVDRQSEGDDAMASRMRERARSLRARGQVSLRQNPVPSFTP
jgi:tetratricopeptide (TPR) repeat protein